MLCFISLDVRAGITFSAPSSRFAILPSARFYIGEVASISGWTRESIVQTNGNNSPLYWDPRWVDGTNVFYEIAPEAFSPKNEGDITTDVYFYELDTDLSLGPNRTLTFMNSDSSNYTFVNGNGYIINLAEGFANLIQIEAGHTVEIANAVIKNYDENSIVLATGAVLKFLNSTIEFIDNRTITRPLDLSGDIIINGYGYTLSFDPGASLNLTAGQLAINNLTMYGIEGQNLRCLTSNGVISLQNSNLFLTGDFRYKNGGFQTQDSVISGFNAFNYESVQTFTVLRTLMLDTGLTFSYIPAVANNRLLWMDPASRLYLNGCTLKTSTTGLQLTDGTLVVDSQNKLYNDGGVAISESIILGNGDSAKDLSIEILPGAKLELMTGSLVYANVDSDVD
jgi:hypothetical protein